MAVFLDPNGTFMNKYAGLFGAATAHEATDDAVRQPAAPDFTDYVFHDASLRSQDTVILEVGSYTLGASERIGSITVWVRARPSSAFGLYHMLIGVLIGKVTQASATKTLSKIAAWYSTTWNPTTNLSQADVDGLRLGIRMSHGFGVTGQLQVTEAYLEVKIEKEKTYNAEALVKETEIDKTYIAEGRVVEVKTKTYQASASLSETISKTYQASASLLGTENLTYDARVTVAQVSRHGTSKHLCASTSFRVLVEVDWIGGARRYAGEDVAVETTGYDGRVVSIGRIVQGTDGRRDALSIEIDNVPRCEAVEDLWLDNAPPESSAVRIYYWFEGDLVAGKIKVFDGVVDQVESVTEQRTRISCTSVEEKYDNPVGIEINTTDFPDAPEQALGKIQPVVFGTVERFEGVPVTTIARSNLSGSLLASETTIPLEDSLKFPSSGTVIIGEEEITYTGKSGNNLTGAARGASATVAGDYGAGMEVVEKGPLEILLSGHDLTSIDAVYGVKGDRIKTLDAGSYTKALTPRGKITFADGWPRISVSTGGTDFTQIQFDAAGVANTALNPTRACGDHTDWTEKNYAEVRTANPLLEVNQTSDVEPIGDILKAWLMVEYDASTVGGSSFRVREGANQLGVLNSTGNLPSEIKNRVGLGTTRAYNDVHTIASQPHAHANPQRTITQFLDTMAGFGSFTSQNAAFDGQFGPGSYTPQGGTNWEFRLQAIPEWVPKGSFTVVAKIDGLAPTPGTGTSTFQVSGGGSSSIFVGTSRGTYSSNPLTVASIAALNNAGTKVFKNNNPGNMVLYEVWYEVTYTPADTSGTSVAQDSDDPLRHTVAYLFDVTSLADGDWGWFKSRSVQVERVSGGDTLRVIRVSFLVEYSPERLEPADRILADVKGLVPDGEPIEILKEIISNSYLLDLGTSYDSVLLDLAKKSHDSLSYRLDFAVVEPVQAMGLIKEVCRQSRLLWWWENGILTVRFRKDLASLGAVTQVFLEDDLIPDRIVRQRTILREAITDLSAQYRHDYFWQRLSKVVTSVVASAIGIKQVNDEFDLIRDDVSAQNLADYLTERWAIPRYVVEFSLYLPGLEVRRGDIIGLNTARFNWTKLEVIEMSMDREVVTIKAIVWDAIT